MSPPAGASQNTYLSIAYRYIGHGTDISDWYLELSPDGGVLRQLGQTAAGEVVHRAGPDDFSVWNDEMFSLERYSPQSAEWQALIAEGRGRTVTGDEFEERWSAGMNPVGAWPPQAETLPRRLIRRLAAMLGHGR